MLDDHSRWFLRSYPLDRSAVAAGSGCGIPRFARNPGWRQCKTGRLKAAAAFAQSANDACIWDAVDGRCDRDPTLPRRDGDYRCYCWPPAAEIAVLAGKRVDGRVSEPGCGYNSDAYSCSNVAWGRIGDIKHKHWEFAQNNYLLQEYNRQASVIDDRG
jgi:hypothetical protein